MPSSTLELALFTALTVAVIGLGIALIARYRRETIEDETDRDPSSDLDLFQEAYFDGEMTAEELAKVREALGRRDAGLGPRFDDNLRDKIRAALANRADNKDEKNGGDEAISSSSSDPDPLTGPSSDDSRPGSG